MIFKHKSIAIIIVFLLIVFSSTTTAQNTYNLLQTYARLRQINALKSNRTLIDIFDRAHDKRSIQLSDWATTPTNLADLAVSGPCKEDVDLFIDSLRALLNNATNTNNLIDRLSILHQIDAGAKLESGILKGNFEWVGSFLECTDIRVKVGGRKRLYQGGYCRVFERLFDDFALKRDVCLPGGCANKNDAMPLVKQYSIGSENLLRVNCLNDDENTLDYRGIIVIVVMFLFLFAVIFGTALDYFWMQHNKEHPLTKNMFIRIMYSFSLYTNTLEIISTDVRPGQIGPIHCIRVCSMIWVITGHCFSFMLAVGDNPFDAFPSIESLTTQILTNAYFAVDSFFFLSGLLIGFMWFKELQRNRRKLMAPMSWLMFYVHRIIRLSPPYYLALAFNAWVLKYFISQGVLSLSIGNFASRYCDKSWWTNFLYISNYVDYENQCYLITWYLSTDMQIHLFAPLVLIPFAIRPVYGYAVSAALFISSFAASIFTVFYFRFPPTQLDLPMTPKDPLMTVDASHYILYMYDAPWIRFPIYLIGLLLGRYLQLNKRKITIRWYFVVLGWMVTAALMLAPLLGLYEWVNGKAMPIFWTAMYATFAKPAWGCGLSWIVFACFYGYGGPIDKFMSWNIWMPLGRLTYCTYLLHFMIICVVFVLPNDSIHFSSFMECVVRWVIPVTVISFLVAIVWSSTFEIATGKIEMILLGPLMSRKRSVQPAATINNNHHITDDEPKIGVIVHTGDDEIDVNVKGADS